MTSEKFGTPTFFYLFGNPACVVSFFNDEVPPGPCTDILFLCKRPENGIFVKEINTGYISEKPCDPKFFRSIVVKSSFLENGNLFIEAEIHAFRNNQCDFYPKTVLYKVPLWEILEEMEYENS